MRGKLTAVLTALCLAAGIAVAIPASAAYQSGEEIAFALRPMETEGCSYETDGNTAFVSTEAAAEGTSVHIGMYIEAEYADLVFLYAYLQSNSANVTFNSETFYNPITYYHDEKQEYTLSNGVTFATRFKPYCFGYINSNNVYVTTSPSLGSNFDEENNSLYLTWMYGLSGAESDTASFLGSTSDELSFVEFDVDLAPGTEPGIYTITFTEGETENGTPLTAVESNDDTVGYVTTIPTTKQATIVVGQKGDANLDDEVNAMDATMILMYAAERGAGGEAFLTSEEWREKEGLACYLADVNGEYPIPAESNGDGVNAMDATAILMYAASAGSGGDPDWDTITGK